GGGRAGGGAGGVPRAPAPAAVVGVPPHALGAAGAAHAPPQLLRVEGVATFAGRPLGPPLLDDGAERGDGRQEAAAVQAGVDRLGLDAAGLGGVAADRGGQGAPAADEPAALSRVRGGAEAGGV